MRRLMGARLFGAMSLTLAVAGSSGAQQHADGGRPAVVEYATDGELENYLRTLQALALVPVHPWSLRTFGPAELRRLRPPAESAGAHPWRGRFGLAPDTGRGLRTWLASPRVETRFNSTFPFGSNDGAVWAGRGLTASVHVGAGLRWGPLTMVVAPVAFWSQNRDFPILDNGLTGADAFRSAIAPRYVDRPQRFGAAALGEVDPGASTIRLDGWGATVGLSTAHEWWGPAQRFPFLLGTNAAGFPHAFAGTSAPADLWLVRLHGRILWGRLDQSDYFQPVGISRPRRFATGLLVTLQPRGLENLEFGAARFIHAPWPDEGLPGRYLLRSFEGLLKRSLPRVDDHIPTDDRSRDGENQLASVFARLVLPGSGFELYSEFGREDHPWDARYLLLNPDEQSSLTVGMRKSWRPTADRIVRLRAESMNFQENSVSRGRDGRVFYLHASGSNQGHTQRGQLLGADIAVGAGAGAFVAADVLDPSGRWSVEWQRIVRQERPGLGADGTANPRALDVVHSVGVERVLFSRRTELTVGATWSYNFHRDFGADRQNLSLRVAASGLSW